MSDVFKYYEVLKVQPTDDFATIKHQYRDLAKIWHPDYNKDPKAMEIFQQIATAYNTLSDETSRAFYDVLSIAYKAGTAPDMKLLKPYKDKKNLEDKSLRVLNIYKKSKPQKVIVSKKEAKAEVLKALLNIKNYFNPLINKQDNLQLMLHNALAYKNENKDELSAIYATQAFEFANKEEQALIARWQKLSNLKPINIASWNYQKLTRLKLIPLFGLSVIGLFFISTQYISNQDLWKFFEKNKEITYFQKVQFKDGRETVDDFDLSKVINYPINLNDDNMLFHLKNSSAIKYGPSKDFDNLTTLGQNATIRITGKTPDDLWFRILLDDGQMGFVEKSALKKGLGNPIPKNSKISF